MLATLAVTIACGLSARPAQAGYIVTLNQVGPDVVATGIGPIDLTGLFFDANVSTGSNIQADAAVIFTGPATSSNGSRYAGIGGPTSFGTAASTTFASSGSGDLVGIIGKYGYLIVPMGYVSGTALSDSSTYNSKTFSSLGVTPGTYEWTWGRGVNQNVTLRIGVAVPDSGSTFGLLLLPLAALFGASHLRQVRIA